MMRQTNDCLSVWVMQLKVMYCVRVGPDPCAELQVNLALGPAGLVQPCPKPRALIHMHADFYNGPLVMLVMALILIAHKPSWFTRLKLSP